MNILKALFCLIVLCWSCQNKQKIDYLQEENVQLVQPKIVASNNIIDAIETISIDSKMKDVAVHYTSNGEEPTQNSKKYTTALKVTKSGIYKFRSFHPLMKASTVSSVRMYKKGLSVGKIKWHSVKNKKYKGVGETTLINNKKATLEFTNPQWQGFDSIASATVVFDKIKYIKNLDIGYLCDPSSWIFPPEKVNITLFLENGKLKNIEKELKIISKSADRSIESLQIPVEANVSSIKLVVFNTSSIPDWHEGKGAKAWLFMDEWMFN